MLNYPNLLILSEEQIYRVCWQCEWAAVTNRDTQVKFHPIKLGYLSKGTPGSYDVDFPGMGERRSEIDERAKRLYAKFWELWRLHPKDGPAQAEAFLRRQMKLRDRWVKEMHQRFLEVRQNQQMVDEELTRGLATAETIKFVSEVALCTLSIFPTGSTVLISYAGRALVQGAGKVLVARLVMPIGYGLFANCMDPRASWSNADIVAVASSTAKSAPSALTETAPGASIDSQIAVQQAVADSTRSSGRQAGVASQKFIESTVRNPALSPRQRGNLIWEELVEHKKVADTAGKTIATATGKANALRTLGNLIKHPGSQTVLGGLSLVFFHEGLRDASNAYIEKLNF